MPARSFACLRSCATRPPNPAPSAVIASRDATIPDGSTTSATARKAVRSQAATRLRGRIIPPLRLRGNTAMMQEPKRTAPGAGQAGPSAEDNFTVTAPAITLPKGGGAISGIGEKFAANPVTGTGTMTVPRFTSPGRSRFGPKLALSYDSGAGNGPFGFGWRLSPPSITRRTDKGLPKYLDADESD